MKVPIYIPTLILSSAFLMIIINVSAYQAGNSIWKNISLSIAIFLHLIAFGNAILKNIHYTWLHAVGVLLSLPFFIPFTYKLLNAWPQSGGQLIFITVTLCLIFIFSLITFIQSMKIFRKSRQH